MTSQPHQSVPPYKQLRRPVDDRLVAGVCSGIARYTGVDPNLVRVIFAVVAVLTWGTALLAYPVMWFIIPEDRSAAAAPGTEAGPIRQASPPPAPPAG